MAPALKEQAELCGLVAAGLLLPAIPAPAPAGTAARKITAAVPPVTNIAFTAIDGSFVYISDIYNLRDVHFGRPFKITLSLIFKHTPAGKRIGTNMHRNA